MFWWPQGFTNCHKDGWGLRARLTQGIESPMLRTDQSRIEGSLGSVVWCVVLFPSLLEGQQLAREALASFPADTQQVAYSNLAQLRASPDYPRIRERILNRQLRYFQDFLRTLQIDPERDVDEVMLGWRGLTSGAAGFFGMAAGHFQPEQVREYFARSKLPHRQYAGSNLYAFGSGEDPNDLYFAFPDSSLAAFGRLADLKALLDVRSGSASPLDANATFVGWESEVEGTAPQWGVMSGKAAANAAAPWFTSGKSLPADLSSFLSPIQAILYRVEWGGGFASHLAILCRDAQSASALAQLLNLLQSAPQPPAEGGSRTLSILQGVEARRDGSRLDLSVSGPIEALDQLLSGTAGE